MTQSNSSIGEMSKPGLGEFARYLGSVALCNGVGIGSQSLSGGADSEWYRQLEKPSFTPPGVAIGAIWSVLYTLMGISLGKLISARGRDANADRAIALFSIQLILNGLWTLIFFRWKSPGWALVEILILFVAIGITFRAVWRVSPLAGALLAPYLAWVGFATLLNGSIWWLNRDEIHG